MSKLTRRKLIAGAAIAPLMGVVPPAPADPVLPLARTWIAERAEADALMARWSDLENQLPKGMVGKWQSDLPEARAMRAIDRRLKRLLVKLGLDAERIAPMRALTRAGALAKIEMALTILEPVDVEEHSWALVAAGFDDLTRLKERG